MKTRFTLLLILVTIVFTSGAQGVILNASFENWTVSTPSVPVSWDSYDDVIQTVGGGAVPQMGWCTKDVTAVNVFAGTASVRLKTDTAIAASGLGLIAGTLFNGKLVYNATTMSADPTGWAFTDRPTVFHGAVKYLPQGVDTSAYILRLTKWDAVADTQILVGIVSVGYTTTGGAFYQFHDTIHYFKSVAPDTLIIGFFSSANANSNSKIGSLLWADDLSLEYLSTGIVHLDMDDAVQVFPNPASSELNIKVDNYMTGYTFEVYDITGKLVKRRIIENPTSTLDISQLSSGGYIYRLSDTNHQTVTQKKFEVLK